MKLEARNGGSDVSSGILTENNSVACIFFAPHNYCYTVRIIITIAIFSIILWPVLQNYHKIIEKIAMVIIILTV